MPHRSVKDSKIGHPEPNRPGNIYGNYNNVLASWYGVLYDTTQGSTTR
jgi:hypothetical protein